MKKNILALGVLLGSLAYAQGTIGVNTNEPKTTFDVSAKRDTNGVLVETGAIGLRSPNLTRAEVKAKEAVYTEAQIGTIIYLTDVTGGDQNASRKNMKEPGYYLFTKDANGLVWERIFVAEGYENMYIIDNEIETNRIVTQGNKTLTFKSNGTGKVIFNNTVATETAPVTSLKIIDGGQGKGKALFSDDLGNGIWKPFAPISKYGKLGVNNNDATNKKYEKLDYVYLVEGSSDGSNPTSITLPPGKWLVVGGTTVQVRKDGSISSTTVFNDSYHASGYVAEFFFSENKNNGATSIQADITNDANLLGTERASFFTLPFYVSGNTAYGFGQQVLHNQTNQDKTYYMKVFISSASQFKSSSSINVPVYGVGTGQIAIRKPFSSVDEKVLFAIKMSDIE